MNKVKTVVVLAIALLAAAVAWFALRPAEKRSGGGGDAPAPGRAMQTAKARPGGAATASRRARPKPVLFDDDDDDDFTPEERRLSDRIEDALDREDVGAVVACVDAALACTNTEIREAMVNALGWFGVKGMAALTSFLGDPDEDVRENAMNEWSMALSEIEDDGERIGVVETAMAVLSDEDALEDISGEYIGVDDKLAVESLLRVIEGGGSAEGVAKAKETYEFVTGDEFVDRATAEKWIAEEYEP